MKQFLLKSWVFSTFFLIITVSDTPFFIKVIFLGTMLFFLLPFNNQFFSKERLMRKLAVAFSGSVLFTILFLVLPPLLYGKLPAISEIGEFGMTFGIVLFYSLLGFTVYGIPVSLSSDWLAMRFRYRLASAAFVHVGFGLLLIPFLAGIPVSCAVLFLLLDELFRKRTFFSTLIQPDKQLDF